MSIEEKSIPNSCRNAAIPKNNGLTSRMSFFQSKANEAIVDKNNSTYQKRKTGSNSNSQDKNNKSETTRNTDKSKSPIKRTLTNESIESIENPCISKKTFDFSQSQRSSENFFDIIPKERNTVYKSINKTGKLPTSDIITKEQLVKKDKKLLSKKNLNLDLSNLDEEEIIQKTRVDELIDSFKKYTPKYHDFVIKYNEESNKFDVIPLNATQDEIKSFSILETGDKAEEKIKNEARIIAQEISFELTKEMTCSNLNTIENITDIRKENDKSLFDTLDNNIFEIENHKLSEQIAKKWNKENEKITFTDEIYSKKVEKLFFTEKTNEISIINQKRKELFIKSMFDFEITINNKENKSIIINKMDDITKLSREKDFDYLIQSNNFEFNLFTKRTCDCLYNWNLKLDSKNCENLTIERLLKIENTFFQNNSFSYPKFKKETKYEIDYKAFDLLCLNKEIVLEKSENYQFSIQGIQKIADELFIKNDIKVNYFPRRRSSTNKVCQTDITTVEICNNSSLSLTSIKKIPTELIKISENFDIFSRERNFLNNDCQTEKSTIEICNNSDLSLISKKVPTELIKTENFDIFSKKRNFLNNECQTEKSTIEICNKSDLSLISKKVSIELIKISENFDIFSKKRNFLNNDCQTEISTIEICNNSDLSLISKKVPTELASQNDVNLEFLKEEQSNSRLSSSPSSKNSNECSNDTFKIKIFDLEIQHELDFEFERKFYTFEKDLKQESINTINYQHQLKYNEIQKNESINILHKKKAENNEISLNSNLAILQKSKQYIMIFDLEADSKRSCKISFLSIFIVILLFCMVFSIVSYFNFMSEYHSINHFKNESLFKWNIVYSEN